MKFSIEIAFYYKQFVGSFMQSHKSKFLVHSFTITSGKHLSFLFLLILSNTFLSYREYHFFFI